MIDESPTLWDKLHFLPDVIFALIDRIIPLPVPYGRYLVIAAVLIATLTYLMRLWERIKPRRALDKAGLRGKHSRKIRKEARAAERAGSWLAAAESWKALGKTQKALQLYERAGANKQAGELLINLGRVEEAITMWEQSSNYNLAAKKLAENKNFDRAAANYERAGNNPQAAEMYEKAGNFEKAGEHYSKAGFHAKAAKCFEKANAILPAARAFERYFKEQSVRLRENITSDQEKAIRNIANRSGVFYLRAGKMEEAAEIFLKGGLKAEAAKAFEKLGDTAQAAKLYRDAGMHSDAARLMETDGHSSEAVALKGEALRSEGKLAEAAKAFAQAGDFHQAADLFAQAEMPRDAAEMLLKAGSYLDAASLFVQAGMINKAAWAFEQARDYDNALKLYQQMNDPEGMVRSLVASNRPLDAAKLYLQQRRGADAYKILETVTPEHEEYRGACVLMAKMLSSQNRIDSAIALVQRAIMGEPMGPDTIDLYYTLGVLFEQRANYPLALDIYTKVLGENIAYKDVALRQQGLRERLAHTAPAPAPAAASTHEKTAVLPKDGAGARANPRYPIIEELGRGGMGVVYKARDTVLDRIVAYKVLPPDLKSHDEVIKKFNKEATSLAKLHHPYIVTVFDAGGIGGEYYFVMEFVEGRNLKDVIREKGALPIPQAVGLFREMADALSYAHTKGVIHRDIKTSNVMLQNDGHIKLMDFGLAKIFEESTSDRTQVSGTPFYMSPEQTLGKGVDHRSDIYSFGVMMYEIASGRVPFPTGDIGYHHLHTEPEPPTLANPNIPQSLEAIILKCMKKEKEERYQSAGDILEDLKKIG